jgi:hypothetical protein
LDDLAGGTSLGISATEVFTEGGRLGEGIEFLEKPPDGPRSFYLYSFSYPFFIPDDYACRADLNALGITIACIACVFDLRNGDFWHSFHLYLNVGAGGIKYPQALPRAGKLTQSASHASFRDNIDSINLFTEDPVGTCIPAFITECAGGRHLAEVFYREFFFSLRA